MEPARARQATVEKVNIMNVIAGGTVWASEKGTDRQSCAFPQVCILPSGRWMCGFRAAPTKPATTGQHALITWSDDEGRPWAEPIQPFVPPFVEGRPGLFRGVALTSLGGREVLACVLWVDHSNPSLPFFNEETEGLLDCRIFFARSEDGGETWSEPELMDTSPFRCPTPTTGPVLGLANGGLACQFELNKHYYEPAEWRHSSVLMFSRDGGKTWPEHSVVSSDPENRIFYWDQRPAVLPDGRILDLFWTYDNRDAAYLNIHARESRDHGRNWSEMWDAGVPGQPAAAVPLPDGGIGMVYMDRTGPPVIKMRASEDEGRTWPDETEIVIYQTAVGSQSVGKKRMQDAWAEMGKFSVGLPATAVMADGDILVLYYAGSERDLTDIKWARVRAG